MPVDDNNSDNGRASSAASGSLAPPVNDELTRRSMERSPSMAMKAERDDLKEAAEDSFNVIMDLNLDGRVRWVSPSWDTVIGYSRDDIQGKPIADILVDDKEAFHKAVETMKVDDSRSYKLRFSVTMGSESKIGQVAVSSENVPENAIVDEGQPEEATEPAANEEVEESLNLEGQGILIYDRSSGAPSHTMWVIRPFVEPTEITIDLPPLLVESLGIGAGMLARYLTTLAENGVSDPANHPPPIPVLCRICERQIQPWWFEKHSELCMLEHRAESEVQLCQENLGMHRQAIVRILDAMERRTSRPVSGEMTPSPTPIEYRGLPIGPSSSSSSGTASPGTPPPPRSRDHSASGLARSRSFPARRPLVRIVELLLDLCDTAIEISTPAIKDSLQDQNVVELGTFRTQSPQSEARISQVLQWQSPTTNTLDEEKGLAQLCQDTEAVARGKVEAVFRHRNTIEYSERIRLEFSMLVQDCIDEAIRKAAESSADDMDDAYPNLSDADDDGAYFEPSFGSALQRSDSGISNPRGRVRRNSSPSGSGTTSPLECSTPRSQQSLHRAASRRGAKFRHRSSIQFDNEGADSDTSAKSSLAAAIAGTRTESPMSDQETYSRMYSRDKARHMAGLGSESSPKRQQSPARVVSSSSPLRIVKPRGTESIATPITSPLLSTGDFSPALEHSFHHRRQSSATLSDQFAKQAPGSSSPRLSGVNPTHQNRSVPPSIKDFEIIKPISKGAFGSVYLSKKKSTGDYFAIKVLKKSDMVAKNQVTNVRAERAIMMVQGESDFVAKLYWTFASKDYLYLVMEYLNGGDCAALIRALSGLPEDWAQKYLAEVVLGVEHLHSRGIVHRDLKPDNLLIDHKGHLKLTDFGLSRMGIVNRQQRAQTQPSESTPDLLKQGPFAHARPQSVASSRSTSFDYPGNGSPTSTPQVTPDSTAQLITPSYFNLNLGRENSLSREDSLRRSSVPRNDSAGSETLSTMLGNFSLNDVTQQNMRRTPTAEDDNRSETSQSSEFNALGLQHVTSHSSMQSQVQQHPQAMMPPQLALFNPEENNNNGGGRFVGTPDYLAPETINGSGQDEMSDWWSMGVILFEFLYAMPPFHAETPEGVFENILARRIDWPDDPDDELASPEARDLMDRLMCMDPTQRLGHNGAQEVKNHPWFTGVNWETLLQEQPSFVPTVRNPEDTDYFDARGATLQAFVEEMEEQSAQASTPGDDMPERPHDAISRVRREANSSKRGLIPLSIPPHVREGRNRRLSEPLAQDDFGSFTFKNLPVLEKANKDVIQKLRNEAAKSTPALTTSNPTSPLDGSPTFQTKPLSRALSTSSRDGGKRPVSPSNIHHHHAASTPARVSQPSSPLLLSFSAGGSSGNAHDRRKASTASASSSFSQQSNNSSLQAVSLGDVPRLPSSAKETSSSAVPSPVKPRPKTPVTLTSPVSTSPTRSFHDPLPTSNPQAITHHKSHSSMPRVRSMTAGSADSEPASGLDNLRQHNRRSQVFDMSPSSSDNEETRNSALLRVQRRRQSARRKSVISFGDAPIFRPLDVLVCEDHPVSRMVMEKLLEKLGCRTIVVDNGPEAIRYAMGEVKFDIILMEFKLRQISGEDVAKMIRTTRNHNCGTPIVVVTGYLKDLADPQYFDELVEKPATPSKLIDILERLCTWKAPEQERLGAGERKVSYNRQPSAPPPKELRRVSASVEQFMSGSPGDDSMHSSGDGNDGSSSAADDATLTNRHAMKEWEILHARSGDTGRVAPIPSFMHQETAPPRLQSQAAGRIPSPLATHVSTGADTLPSGLPSPPEMAPLPPSITSTTAFGKSAMSAEQMRRSPSPCTTVVREESASTDTMAMAAPVPVVEERPQKSSFLLKFSSTFMPKEHPKEPKETRADPETSPEPKSKTKRSSLEKKMDKLLKPTEDADADDEDSMTGVKRPTKSRSIGEFLSGKVKRSPPEMKRTKSNDGRNPRADEGGGN